MTNTKKNTPASGSGKSDSQKPQPGQQGQGKQRSMGSTGSDEDPEKKIQIDDNPEETKRKIPHMNK